MSYILSGKINEYAEFRQFLLNFLPFFAFYYFTTKGILTEKKIKIFFILLLITFILNMQTTSLQLEIQTGRDEFANNASYHIMGLLPFVFLIRKRFFTLFLILLFFWYSLGSMKRSVLIISLFSMILFTYSIYYEEKNTVKIKGLVIALLLSGALLFSIQYYYLNIGIGERFEERIMLMIYEGHSAGRDVLIKDFFEAWLASENIFSYIFGLGYGSSTSVISGSAHNDFMQILGENGLIGLIIFLLLFFYLISNTFKLDQIKKYKIAYIMLISSMIMSALTSRWYGSSFFYMNCILLPFLLASNNKILKNRI